MIRLDELKGLFNAVKHDLTALRRRIRCSDGQLTTMQIEGLRERETTLSNALRRVSRALFDLRSKSRVSASKKPAKAINRSGKPQTEGVACGQF